VRHIQAPLCIRSEGREDYPARSCVAQKPETAIQLIRWLKQSWVQRNLYLRVLPTLSLQQDAAGEMRLAGCS